MSENNAQLDKICVRCIVAGRVQGVFFRASARAQAQALGLAGYARNLLDGRVEVLACGNPNDIEQFKAWLGRGPSAAQVSGVACESVPVQDLSGFSTG